MKKVEVEGGEIAIRNSAGDVAIIPKDKVSEVQEAVKNKCWGCIDKIVSSLPPMEDIAEDGTIVSELYKNKTGLEWSTAKERGLTDGSYEANIALAKRLQKGEDLTSSILQPEYIQPSTVTKKVPERAPEGDSFTPAGFDYAKFQPEKPTEVYVFPGREGAEYIKKGDKWQVSLGAKTGGKFVDLVDPNGIRTKNLNEKALLKKDVEEKELSTASKTKIDISQFIIDEKDYNQVTNLRNKYAQIHELTRTELADGTLSAPGCVSGALNCNMETVGGQVGATTIRGLMQPLLDQGKDKKYRIKSKAKGGDYAINDSLDAWELGDFMVGEGIGTDLYDTSKTVKYNKRIPNNLDISKIPIGALVFQGSSIGTYTKEEDGKRPRHVSTVVGYNKQGVPLTYDYGKLVPITETLMEITRVVVPKGYENRTLDGLQKMEESRFKKLGYTEGKYEYAIDTNHPNQIINTADASIANIQRKVSYDYAIPRDVAEKIKKRVVSIGVQETGLYGNVKENSVGRSMKIAAEQSALINAGKTVAAPMINLLAEAVPTTKTQDNKNTYEREMIIYNDLKAKLGKKPTQEQVDKEMARYYEIRDKKSPRLDGNPSVGAFKIKNQTDYAEKELGISKGDLYGIFTGNKSEIEKGAQSAYVYVIENYSKLRDLYPDLSTDELIDLATVSYNSASKTQSPSFIKNYIVEKNLKDDYLSKVKAFEQKFYPSK